MLVGIDFGTCFSSAAIMSGAIPVTNFIKDASGLGIPSAFMYSEAKGKELYGDECFTGDSVGHEGDIIRYMKRTVRENPGNLQLKVASGGQEYTIEQVIEKYLTYLVSRIRTAAIDSGEFQNSDIDAVTITAPVGIASGQMMASEYNKLLKDAMVKITGLREDRVNVIHEPVAAAIAYLYSEDIRKHYEGKQTVLLFDLGGGTLDVTIMEHDPFAMTYEIKAREGDLLLGGNDWDQKLADLVLQKTGIDRIDDPNELWSFKNEVTSLKVALTKKDNQSIMFTCDGEDAFTRVTREEFEDATSDLTDRAIDVVRKAIDSYEGDITDISRIILVGGSSNMPMIEKNLSVAFPELGGGGVVVFDPSRAIAKGAAVYSKLLWNAGGTSRGPKVLDCASHTYGFDSNYECEIPMIYNMIFKGTKFGESNFIRVKSESSFIPIRDSQTRVSFKIYESEGKPSEGDNPNWMPLGSGEKYNGMEVTVQVPPEYLGKARGFSMWAILSLDLNGILELTIVDRAGNKLGFASSSKREGSD